MPTALSSIQCWIPNMSHSSRGSIGLGGSTGYFKRNIEVHGYIKVKPMEYLIAGSKA